MASEELEWAKKVIAEDRGRAGVSADYYDLRAARASLPESHLPLPEGIRVEQVLANGVTCYWVVAAGADTRRIVVYSHGGGFQIGGFHSHRPLAAWLSAQAGAAVLFPEYRLAPEHRFPAGVEDCYNAYLHALENGPNGEKQSPSTIFVGGDSSGGALAVATVLLSQSKGVRKPDGAIILCGLLDLSEETSKFLKMSQRSRDGLRLYVGHLKDLANPLASSILADLNGFPPLLIQTGTEDYCADDNLRFAERARNAGIDVTFESWPDMIHVWHRFAPKLPEAMESLARIGEWIRLTEGDRTEPTSRSRNKSPAAF